MGEIAFYVAYGRAKEDSLIDPKPYAMSTHVLIARLRERERIENATTIYAVGHCLDYVTNTFIV